MAALPAGLLRPTMQPETIPAEVATDDQAETNESRGGDAKPTAKTRKKRVPVGGETRGRKLHLPDGIHDRLWLLARQRRVSVSAVAADILDKNLPRYRVEREN